MSAKLRLLLEPHEQVGMPSTWLAACPPALPALPARLARLCLPHSLPRGSGGSTAGPPILPRTATTTFEGTALGHACALDASYLADCASLLTVRGSFCSGGTACWLSPSRLPSPGTPAAGASTG